MVEAPRIRITYDTVKFTKNRIIISASGATYKKAQIDLVGYRLKKWWFAGKYIYLYLIKNSSEYVCRTHMMMYGRIIVNNSQAYPNLTPFLILKLDDNTTLTWYLSQIKFLDPNCETDIIKTNYSICSSRKNIADSFKLMKYDVSNDSYDPVLHLKHLIKGISEYRSEILVDFLLDQQYFPGVGNILQQEILYRCRLSPTKKIFEFGSGIKLKKILVCIIKQLKELVDTLYQSYLGTRTGKILQIYHKSVCPLGHKTTTKYLGFRRRKTTWCPICQE